MVSCFFSHQLLQSLEQEMSPPAPPPAPEPSTKEDIKLSIGFTDLNGDLISCLSDHCYKMVTKSCLLKCCTVTVLLSSCCSCATHVGVSTLREWESSRQPVYIGVCAFEGRWSSVKVDGEFNQNSANFEIYKMLLRFLKRSVFNILMQDCNINP